LLDGPFRILKDDRAAALSVGHYGSRGEAFLALVPFWDYAGQVRVIAVATLRAFWQKHPDAEQPLKAWFEEATKASWTQPSDIKAHYRSASVLKNRRVVFNIKGNEYRLIVAIAYRLQIVYVKFIGTHAEYDTVDADNVEPD
jgi:mRNA interferase HigB